MSETDTQTGNGRRSGRNPWLFIGGLFLLGIALALLLFGGGIFQNSEPANLQQVPALDDTAEIPILRSDGVPMSVGDTAHAFTLNDTQGNPVALTDLRGQPVIVNFWATWCAPCRLEMPEFQELHDAHQEDGLVILALNQAESVEDVDDFFSELGLTFTSLMDEDTAVSDAYGAFNLPSTFFINADGEITAVHRGLLTKGQAEEYLAETIQ